MILSYIPSPTISQFSIGPVTIHIYALCMLAGVVAAIWIGYRRWSRVGGDFDQILDIALVAVPSGIIGARIYHIITTPERFFGPSGNWVEMFRVWNGGLGIWGGIALGALAAWAWCRHRDYPMALLADAIAPGLLVAQAIGRLGNWFNQELYGSPTTLPWGLKLNTAGTAIGQSEVCYDGATCPTGTLFHPTFLYEMIWNLIGAVLIIWIGSKVSHVLKAGSMFVIYVLWYTAGRSWIESLRIDYAHEFLGVRINVWVSLCVFVAAVAAFVVVQRVGTSTQVLSGRLRAVTKREHSEQIEHSEHIEREEQATSNPSNEANPSRSHQSDSSETGEHLGSSSGGD